MSFYSKKIKIKVNYFNKRFNKRINYNYVRKQYYGEKITYKFWEKYPIVWSTRKFKGYEFKPFFVKAFSYSKKSVYNRILLKYSNIYLSLPNEKEFDDE